MLTSKMIKEVAPASRFDKNDPIFQIMPETKTVIGLAFRVLRGIYRGIAEGSTYYQYTTMAVENMEEKGVLTKKFKTPFRKREEWKFNIEDWK